MIIQVLNTALEVIGKPIEDYYSLIWVERYSEVGDFELELPIEYALDSSLVFGNFLYISVSDKVMIIEDIKPSFGEEKTSLLIKGQSSECILKRRVLLDPINVDDVAESIIYMLLDENVTAPGDNARVIGLISTFFPSVSTSETIEEQIEMQSVYETVKTICKITGLGFKMVWGSGNLLYFSVYKGEDRSYAQGTNPYVIFSDDFDNVITSSFYESIKDKVNIVLVATDDDPTYQRTFVWEDPSEPAGLSRLETVLETTIDRDLDAPPLSDAEALAIINTRGIQIIKENKLVGLFEGDFDIRGNFEYGVDFFMGDIVQCNLEGRNVKARIIELVRSYSVEGEKSYVAMNFII